MTKTYKERNKEAKDKIKDIQGKKFTKAELEEIHNTPKTRNSADRIIGSKLRKAARVALKKGNYKP